MMPTVRGILFLMLTAPLLAASVWWPELAWVALVYGLAVLLLLLLDWWQAGSVARRFEVARVHDSKLSLGADNPVVVRVRNRTSAEIQLQLRDEPPDAFAISQRILEGRIGPRQTWEGSYTVRPPRRGDYAFGDVNLRWLGPLRLIVRQGKVEANSAVKVYPNLMEVRRYDILLKGNRLQELGLRSTRQFGEGTEFERLREYTPDDEYRRINWKATARRRRPVTMEFQTERSQTVMALIDTGRMMQSPVASMAKLDYVINAVLLLSYVASGKGDKVGMMSFADGVQQYVAPKQGRGQFYRLLERLYAVEPQPGEPDYGQAFSFFQAKYRKRSLVIIFTDLSGGMSTTALVNHTALLARRSLPLVVTISDPDVVNVAQHRPHDSLSMYQRSAAVSLLNERQVTLDHMRQQGVLTLDVPANELSIAVINRYLALKARMLL